MGKKLALPLFLIFSSASAALYFSLQLASVLFLYCSLTSALPAQIRSWQVQEADGKFSIRANYSFDFKGRPWDGSWVFPKPWHLNEPSAIAKLKELAQESWEARFCPSDPSCNALQREFPLGLCIRTLTCYGILVYFIFLSRKLCK